MSSRPNLGSFGENSHHDRFAAGTEGRTDGRGRVGVEQTRGNV